MNVKVKLYNQFIIESFFANLNKYPLLKLINLFNSIKNKLSFKSKIFLEDDYGIENKEKIDANLAKIILNKNNN